MSAAHRVGESEPLWFGPPQRPLLGWLDRPAGGTARGGVLVCPPFGIELSHSHGVLRRLARALSAAGFAVLRFDYDGTGQSAGALDDPDRLDAWRRSIHDAIGVLDGIGVPWLAGVGLRLGATLLADAAAAVPALGALVLWDPCPSGHAFLREQATLHLVACPPCELTAQMPPAPGVEITGYRVGEALAADLRHLALPAGDALAGRRVMVLADPERVANAKVRATLPEAEWCEYAAAEAAFDPGEIRFRAPETLIAQISGWLSDVCTAVPVAIAPPRGSRAAVVGRAPDGTEIVETTVRLGGHGLVGIECAPRSGGQGPTVLLLSLAAESSIGPVRQWVELARRWAAVGVRSIRVDLSGLGESPARPGLPQRTVYAHEHVEEILDVAAAASPDNPRDVVLVGVCSGAIHALAAGPRLRPRGLVAVNPILTFVMPDRPGAAPTSGPSALPKPAGLAPPVGRLRRARRELGARLPRVAWTALYALGFASSPAARLRPLARAGVDTLLMLGDNESRVPLARTPSAIAQLNATGRSEVAIIPGFDHSLRTEASRRRFAEAATDFLADVSERPLRTGGVGALAPEAPAGALVAR